MGNIGLLLTFILLLGAILVGASRFRMRADNSWPLAFYALTVFYLNGYELVLNPNVVYVSVVCALFERFEFLNERIIFCVRLIEVICLAHMSYCLFGVLRRAF